MAKLIQKTFGKLISVEPTGERVEDVAWGWRKKFEDFYGVLHIYQSQHKHPGKYFIALYDIELQYLKTSAGELIAESNRIILITKNSKYTFEYLEQQEKDGE